MGTLRVYGETFTSLIKFLSGLGMNKKEMCVFHAYTTYFGVGIKNEVTLSLSNSN